MLSNTITGQDLSQPVISNKRLTNASVSESRLITPTVHNMVFDGLLVEQSYIAAASLVDIIARNTIIGPGSCLTWSYVEDVKFEDAHAVLNAVIADSILADCSFSNGTLRTTQFNGSSFVDTVFVACKFAASVFQKCTFSGCMFYKCSFSHTGEDGNFITCDWIPPSIFGHFVSSKNNWPSLSSREVEKNYFVHCTGKIRFKGGVHGITNVSNNHVEGERVFKTKFPFVTEPKTLGGNKAVKYAFGHWWRQTSGGNETTIPLPAASGTTSAPKKTLPVKHRHRAYRFKTAGV